MFKHYTNSYIVSDDDLRSANCYTIPSGNEFDYLAKSGAKYVGAVLIVFGVAGLLVRNFSSFEIGHKQQPGYCAFLLDYLISSQFIRSNLDFISSTVIGGACSFFSWQKSLDIVAYVLPMEKLDKQPYEKRVYNPLKMNELEFETIPLYEKDRQTVALAKENLIFCNVIEGADHAVYCDNPRDLKKLLEHNKNDLKQLCENGCLESDRKMSLTVS